MISVELLISEYSNQAVTNVQHNYGDNLGARVGLLGTSRTISFGISAPLLESHRIRGEMGVHGSCIEIEPVPYTQRTLQATELLWPSLPLQLIISGTSLKQMPLLNCQLLKSYREQRLAHLVLSLITMGYVWQEGETQPAEVRNRCLSCHGSELLSWIWAQVRLFRVFLG